jgi:hypothetical protein
MTRPDLESELLAQAKQQTDALRNIQSALMLIAALAVLAAVWGLVVLVRG